MAAGTRHTETRRQSLPPLDERPTCSIILPCLNEEPYIEAAVRTAMEQRYPKHLVEILVADGGSKDRTCSIVSRLAAEDARVRLIENPGRFPSAGMNAGIRAARGDVIVRMDAHATYSRDYVRASIGALRRTGAANAGGAARARYRSAFQREVCAALSSPLGVGGSAYRDPSREGFVESVWGGAFRREIFEEVGLFDEAARANEDAELNQRIIEAGFFVYLCRDAVAFYYPRASLGALARQYFAYGEGRARTLLRRRRMLSFRPLVPFAMVTLLTLLGAFSLVEPRALPLFALALALYAGIVVVESARVVSLERTRALPVLAVIFTVMHFAHGLGLMSGLVQHASILRERHPTKTRGAG